MDSGLSPEDLKRMKREASIKEKEDDFAKKLVREEERKREQLEQLKLDFEQQEQRKKEERVKFLQKKAEILAQKQREQDRLNARREDRIKQKNDRWRNRANLEVKDILDGQEQEEDRLEQLAQEARQRKHDRFEAIEDRIRAAKDVRDELEMKREEKNQQVHTARELREVHRVDQLKTEASMELESFIIHPAPVPLKQVLAGRSRPVPKVSELLSSLKDQQEDLADLISQDIPMRALIRNQSLFQYVNDIQTKAENERIKPPEPRQSDLGRGAKTQKRSPSSPGRRGSASFGASGTKK